MSCYYTGQGNRAIFPQLKRKNMEKIKPTPKFMHISWQKPQSNTKKTSSDLQNDLKYPEVKISASLVKKRVVLAGRKARKTQ